MGKEFVQRTTRSAKRMMLVALLGVLAVAVWAAFAALAANPPAAPSITSAPANPTNQTSASFTSTDSGNITKFQCSLDGAAFVDCGTTKPSTKAYSGLSASSHAFQVRAVGSTGTSSATSYTWVIDSTPPAAPAISSKPSDPSDNRSPSFGFTATESGETFLCALDTTTFTACSNPIGYSSLAIGAHTFQVKGKDAAGNISASASGYTWTIVPPAPAINSKPANPTNQTSAGFSFSDSLSGATFVCSLDGSTFAACTSPKSYTGLTEATHTFQVKAVFNNQQSAATVYSWRIDLSPPAIAMIFPTDGGSYTAAGWNGGCAGGAGLCGTASDPSGVAGSAVSIQQLSTGKYWNGSSFGNSTETFNAVTQVSGSGTTWSGRYPLALPPAGSYRAHIRASDNLGNTSTAANQTTVNFTIDTTAPPAPSITGHPANPTTTDSATFTFTDSEAAVSFQCKLDGGSYAPCTSAKTYTGLSLGSHTFKVQAKDGAGNLSSEASFSWTINTGAPFTVHGSVSGLTIGVEQSVPVTIDNPNDTAIYVSQIAVALSTSTGSGTCTASNFTTTNWTAASTAAELLVPANASNYAVPAASRPKVTLSNLPSNQDVCKNKTFTLTFSGSAHS